MDVAILAHLQAIAAPAAVPRWVDPRVVRPDERTVPPVRVVPALDETLGAGLDRYL